MPVGAYWMVSFNCSSRWRRRASVLLRVEMSCTIAVKVGEEDKMYGSVTPADVAEALEAQGVTVDRHKIGLEAPIKELGVFTVPVRLHPEVGATVKLWVVEE